MGICLKIIRKQDDIICTERSVLVGKDDCNIVCDKTTFHYLNTIFSGQEGCIVSGESQIRPTPG